MDEVYGRVVEGRPLRSGRQEVQCDLCAKSEQINSASGFCQNCNEFLCSTCLQYHNKFTAHKDHTVLEDAEMPVQRPTSIAVEKCSKHPDRPLEMYCIDDDILGCTLCFFIEHKSCQNVDMISNLSKDTRSSDELAEIQRASKKQKDLCNKFKDNIVKFRLTNDQCHTECLENFKSFRTEIEAILDRIEEEVLHKADVLQKENTEKLDSLSHRIISLEQQIESCMEDVDGRLAYDQTYDDQLFIAVKKYKKQVLDDVLRLEQLDKEIHIQAFDFTYEPSIKVLLKRDCKVRVKDDEAAVTRCTDGPHENNKTHIERMTISPRTKCSKVAIINIKTEEDNENCMVYGMVAISGTLLILTDFANSCLKLLDVDSGTFIKRKVLTAKPDDITILPGSRVGVALPNIKQIMFFTADQSLEPCGNITVGYQCRSLSCSGNNIVVSYNRPPVIQILDLEGCVIQSIEHTTFKKAFFNQPIYVSVSDDSKFIYISIYKNNSLICINKAGVIHWLYKDDQLRGPTGVVTGDGGCVYLCSWNTNTIHVVSSEGDRLAVIPLNQSKVERPRAACYFSHNRTLYVSSENADHRNYISILHLQ